MPQYSCGFYRLRHPFGEKEIQATLSALELVPMGFFPMSMWVSPEHKEQFSNPGAFWRQTIPHEYYISPGQAHIPLHCDNGAALAFTESDQLMAIPASVAICFDDKIMRDNRWSLVELVTMIKGVVSAFRPDVAELWDQAHRGRSSYQDRMFKFDMRRVPLGLYWLNYFSPEWVANIGEKRLRELSTHVALEEWLSDGGVLIALQQEPYDETNPRHRERQLFLEQKVLDLPAVQARFPNPGL